MIPLFPIVVAESAVTALLGTNPTRFYPFANAPQNGALPYAVWQIVSGQPFNTLSCPAPADHYTIQADVYSLNAHEAREVAEALRGVFEADNRITITNWAREEYEHDTKLHRVSFDFDFIQNRS